MTAIRSYQPAKPIIKFGENVTLSTAQYSPVRVEVTHQFSETQLQKVTDAIRAQGASIQQGLKDLSETIKYKAF
jgi:hypothetical protein